MEKLLSCVNEAHGQKLCAWSQSINMQMLFNGHVCVTYGMDS